jgi:hypothetical protein
MAPIHNVPDRAAWRSSSEPKSRVEERPDVSSTDIIRQVLQRLTL